MSLQLIFDALALGGIYAIAALGIALIFGVMRLVNFAHGQFIACAVFALILPSTDALAVLGLGRLPAPALIPLIICVGAGLAVAAEALVFRPMRNASPVTLMVGSFALGVALQNLLLVMYGGRPKAVSLWAELGHPVQIVSAEVPLLQLIVILAIGLILGGLALLLRHTRIGLEMRAAAQDFDMARMLGVRANRVISGAFALSGGLAAVVALVLVAQTGVADVRMGGQIMLVAFIATVMGGMGSLSGAVAAGLGIGVVSALLQAGLPNDARPFRDAFLYGGVILVLLFRPQGLFAAAGSKPRV
jgi:branched-chain amino acid transport system permease protein